MASQRFYRHLPIGRSFLGAGAQDLANLISNQGNEFFKNAGICIPARAVSTILFLRQNGPCSLVEVARALEQPHQLTSKRIASLEKLSILTREPDPNDQRRTIVQLTKKGQKEADKVERRCRDAEAVFDTIYEEIGVDLLEAIIATQAALLRLSMNERMGETGLNPSDKPIVRPSKKMKAL